MINYNNEIRKNNIKYINLIKSSRYIIFIYYKQKNNNNKYYYKITRPTIYMIIDLLLKIKNYNILKNL